GRLKEVWLSVRSKLPLPSPNIHTYSYTSVSDTGGKLGERKSSAPETEEKVRRLRRKNTELAVLAKRLEERARKLQEANLRVNSPSLMRPGSVEQYKRAFARQRARDLAHHADALLWKDKEIAALQQECRDLEARLGPSKVKWSLVPLIEPSSSPSSQAHSATSSPSAGQSAVKASPSLIVVLQESELSNKRKECENLEHEVKKRQKRCLDLVSHLPCPPAAPWTRAENEELREDLSEVTAQHNSVLEENQRLRAKLENLEQVLKHMREVAERRQQLELEHEQALAILKFKQDEIKRLQRVRKCTSRGQHEGTTATSKTDTLTVRELEEKCRSQSEQFGLLSQELEKFRLQASKVDLAGSTLLNNPGLSVLTNGVGLTTDRGKPRPPMWPPPFGWGPHPTPPGCPGWSARPSPSTESCPPSASASRPLPPVDTASEVEELDIDLAPAPYTPSRGAAKLQVFIARYSYNPYDGPNDNPEVELPLTAGEYIYVYGDMDDDGFYEGELMDGRRGLVPSNFVERVSDDDVMSSHHQETVDVSHNSLLDSSLHSASHQHHLHAGVSASERTEASAASGPAPAPSDPTSASTVPAPLTNGLDVDLEEVGVDIVPYPRKLTLIKQLAKSIIIGWDPPLVPAGWGNVWSYNVYVDQELRLNVPFGAQTKAVLERLDINLKAYRVSVQSLTEKGLSDQMRCSMLVGRDVCVAPTQLRVDRVTATSANLTWLPSNSNYVHIVSLNEEECELVKAGCYSLCLNNLLPSLQYTLKVEARPHRTPWELPAERREHRSATITFNTLMAGPPDAPLDVQLEHGPSPGIALISWLPVTIDAAGTSNGVRVTGYTIYADKKKVLEVSSPTAGSALLGPSQIQSLQAAQELTVRTTSAHGESCDSLPVNVPSKLAAIMAGPAATSPAVPATPPSCVPLGPPSPVMYGNSAAKVSTLPGVLPSNPHAAALTVDATANALLADDLLPSASYAKALGCVFVSVLTGFCVCSMCVLCVFHVCSVCVLYVFRVCVPCVFCMCSACSVCVLQGYCRGLVEPQSDYQADNSRSDLSDILEEEEEDLYSDHLGDTQTRGYGVGLNRLKSCRVETPDSDEEVLERILKLPPQIYHSKQLFSIPEVTEEEDSSQEDPHHGPPRPRPGHTHLHYASQHHPHHPHVPPQHHHFNRVPRALSKEPSPRHGGSTSRRVSARPPQPNPHRALIGGLGDRLRREAMLRSQKAAAGVQGHGLPPPRPHPVSKTVRSIRSPTGRGMEIDVEYGTDTEEAAGYGPGGVVVEQMSSEWWVEGAQMEHSRPPHRRGPKPEPMGNVTAGQQWVCCPPTPHPPSYDVRIFVALFPYDPVTMSPNPDAAEEELPFSEGQIIKVYGDKDADGFYQGESAGRLGFVPCNMVSEIQVEDEETRQQLLHQGFLSTAASMDKIGTSLTRSSTAPPPPGPGPGPPPSASSGNPNPLPGARRMVAIFDYDPRESSPNTDIEAELTFSAGDVIHVFGDMDEDGFFYGDLNGHRGLVPSNFLQALPEGEAAPPPPEPKKESQVSETRTDRIHVTSCVVFH
uniref:RIMS-binding protein 2 n=1 Tax=Sphaeramia orbicularis TaxID=375764 RepID=A0A673BS58_9TELE